MQRPSFSIYDASAGSGKTHNLVKEYLKIILTSPQNDAYRNILAITFTNKAVHEMKSRIVNYLSDFASEAPSDKSKNLMLAIVEDTKNWKNALTTSAIKSKSKHIIRDIIHNYAAFDILTIDKFTHRVIRAFAYDLGLSMNFEVTVEAENLLSQAVDQIIARAGEDKVLTKLLVDFTMEKTDDDKSWDIAADIFKTGKLILNENNRKEIANFKGKEIEDLQNIKNKISQEVKDTVLKNRTLAQKALAVISDAGIDIASFTYGTFPNHIKYIIEDDPRVTKYCFTEISHVKIKKGAIDATLIEGKLPEILDLLQIVYANNVNKNFYRAFLKNITPLSLLNTVSKEFAEIQTDQNVLTIAEFNAIIHHEIQNQPAPFIYERIGERYHHFFIDEFQDTSEMQWQNLIPLINNATSSEINGEKGTLMIVGDPKQSIYRWRGGKAEQFIALSKAENPFNNPQKAVVPLYTNYRSYSEVINFNNNFFQFLSAEFENLDYLDLYQNHVKQEFNNKIGGYVNLTFLDKTETITNDESEDESWALLDQYLNATFNCIQNSMNQGFVFSDIAILTRKKNQGVAIANFLTEQNIPILSSETLLINNSSEVQLIINFLRYIKSKNDKEAQAHFLYYLAKNSQSAVPIHDFILRGMELKSESELENWLADWQICISFDNLRKKSLYEIVEVIISRLLQPLKNNAYVQYFLDIVSEKDIKYQLGISDFLDFWNKSGDKLSIPSVEGTNAVKIMTVHKSKGLEFPVVIFPFADENYINSPKDKMWLDSEETTFGVPKVLIDYSKAIEGFGPAALSTFKQKNEEILLDNINILYVVLTRAEEQLYIISSLNLNKDKTPRKDNMSSFFVNYLKNSNEFDESQKVYEYGNPIKLSVPKKQMEAVVAIPKLTETLDFENIKIAQQEALMWGTNQQYAIEYGNVVHEILSFIKTRNDVDKALEIAISSGLIAKHDKLFFEKSILEIVSHAQLSESFGHGNIVLNEKMILLTNGKIVKPDRIVINNKQEVTLIDYKTGFPKQSHKDQVENYKFAIEKMGYKVNNKLLVYIGEKIEVIYSAT